LYNKAVDKLRSTLTIFRERGHLEGQTLCHKLLIEILKKLKKQFIEHVNAKKKVDKEIGKKNAENKMTASGRKVFTQEET
jgi:hypothetical protein